MSISKYKVGDKVLVQGSSEPMIIKSIETKGHPPYYQPIEVICYCESERKDFLGKPKSSASVSQDSLSSYS